MTASNSTAMSTWALTLRLIEEGKLDLPGLVSLRLPLAEWELGFRGREKPGSPENPADPIDHGGDGWTRAAKRSWISVWRCRRAP